nr:Arc family DNA-binding protein [uncultured Oscillibacter sp.]
MPSMLPRYTLRVSKGTMSKLKRIADRNGRSVNKEIEQLILAHIENEGEFLCSINASGNCEKNKI